MSLRGLLSITALLVFSLSSFAGQVTLKNGDRLTGTIVNSDDKELVIKTDYAGEVTVKLTAIQTVNSDTPLHVELKDGKSVVGPLKSTDDKVQVETANAGVVPLPIENLKSLQGQADYEREQHPTLWQDWAGGIATSFALTRGNSETKSLALAFTADRKTLHDHLGLYASSVFASNDAPDAVPHTTANAAQGGLRYDRNFRTPLFGFAGTDFQTDALQDLDLRSVFSGGLGVHLIKSDRTTLDFLCGLNYTRENYTQLSRNVIAGNFGEEFAHKFSSTVLTQKLYVYPNLNDLGDYRATFSFATVTKLNKWLGWQNSFSDIYVTNPPAGNRQNDVFLTTGLNVSFGH